MNCEFSKFLIAKYAASRQEAHAFGYLKGEAGAATWNNVNDELGMLPVFELVGRHVERITANGAHEDIPPAGFEVTRLEAHRCTAIATSPRLVEDKRTEPTGKFGHECLGRFRRDDAFDHVVSFSSYQMDAAAAVGTPAGTAMCVAQKKPSAFGL